jgi:hypothetical protein
MAPVNDFTFYWTAARQLLAGQNPYAPSAPNAFVMLAPPWTFAVTLGFGFLPLEVAQSLWLAVSLVALAISAIWFCEIYCDRQRPLVLGLFIATFSPVLITFLLGQIVPLVILGLAGFLRYEPSRQYRAGAFLFLASLKPHIVFLVWPALLLCGPWLGRKKALAGFFGTWTMAVLIVFAIRPRIFQEYWWIVRSRQIAFYRSPTAGALLSRALGVRFLQYLPLILAICWFVWIWKKDGEKWNWKGKLPLLLAVSVASAPYAWFSDQAVLAPALLDAVRKLQRSTRSLIAWAAIYLTTNLAGLFLIFTRRSLWYAGLPAVWLMFYWTLLRLTKRHPRTTTDIVSSGRKGEVDA